MRLPNGTFGIEITEYPFYDVRFIPYNAIYSVEAAENKKWATNIYLSEGLADSELLEIYAMESYGEIMNMFNETTEVIRKRRKN